MNLPHLIQQLYGTFAFTGLYSFEFVDSSRSTICEIFFMMPPKSKDVEEGTRATVNPTIGGNFITDGGNSIKRVNLKGELWFPHIGSPDNPLAPNGAGLPNQTDALTEFFTLRWMLIRYRDYCRTKNSKVDIPVASMQQRPEIGKLYAKVEDLVSSKVGAMYDQVQLIFHDYDMDDHYYARVDSFSSNQNDAKYVVMDYTISLECYERDDRQHPQTLQVMKSIESEIDTANYMLQKA